MSSVQRALVEAHPPAPTSDKPGPNQSTPEQKTLKSKMRLRSPRTKIDSLFYSFRFCQRCRSINHSNETHHHSTHHKTLTPRTKHIQGQHNPTDTRKTQSASRKIPQREQYPHTTIQDQQTGTAIAAVKQDISAGTAISCCQQQEPQLTAVTQLQQQEPHFTAAIH